MKGIVRFYNMTFGAGFVTGIHVAALVGAFFTIKLLREGNYGAALTAGIMAVFLALACIGWWRRS
jgi:hypothetical protein